MRRMTESSLIENLRVLLEDEMLEDLNGNEHEVKTVRTFEEVGMLTNNSGLVVRMTNGEEFQLTIVQSR